MNIILDSDLRTVTFDVVGEDRPRLESTYSQAAFLVDRVTVRVDMKSGVATSVEVSGPKLTPKGREHATTWRDWCWSAEPWREVPRAWPPPAAPQVALDAVAAALALPGPAVRALNGS